jgi:hypothetical protein
MHLAAKEIIVAFFAAILYYSREESRESGGYICPAAGRRESEIFVL